MIEPLTCQQCLIFTYDWRGTNSALNKMLPADLHGGGESTRLLDSRQITSWQKTGLREHEGGGGHFLLAELLPAVSGAGRHLLKWAY